MKADAYAGINAMLVKRFLDQVDAWNDNDTDQLTNRKMATYCSDDKEGTCANNDVWTPFETVPGPAFAVLGSK